MNLERWLPRQLRTRFAVLALGCAGLLFLLTAPAIVGLSRMLLFERQARQAHEHLEIMMVQGDGELRAIRQQAVSLTDTLEQWSPRSLNDWYSLLQFAIEHLPKAETIRVIFRKDSPLAPEGAGGLYLTRKPDGTFERGVVSYQIDDPDSPAAEWFADLKDKKPAEYVDGVWSRPHIPPESPGRKVTTVVAPVIQSESEERQLAGVVTIDVATEAMRDSIKCRVPLQRHMAFIVDKNRKIALATREEPGMTKEEREAFAADIESRPDLLEDLEQLFDPNNPVGWFVARNPVDGSPTCFVFDEFPHNNSKFVLAVPKRDLEGDWYGLAIGVGALGIFTMLGMALLLRWSAGLATRNLDILREGVARVRAGDLRTQLSPGVSHDETADIIDAFNGMIAELQGAFQRTEQMARAQQRYATEMELARRIQKASLPEITLSPGCEIFARTLPAQEIGGDFYEYFPLPGGRLAFAIGDVSGKGLSAALFAARAVQLLRGAADSFDPAEAVTHVNAQLARSNAEMMFITLFFAVWDPARARLEWVNAGHNPPFLKRRDGSIERLDHRCGPAIGPVPGLTFESRTTAFSGGDELLAFTDGITEAPSASNEQFGEPRLAQLFAGPAGLEARAAAIVEAACAWQVAPDRFDDITLVLARALAPPATLTLPAHLAEIETVVNAVQAAARDGGMPEAGTKEIGLAVCEAVTNTIQHALRGDPAHMFSVYFGWSADSLVFRMEDEGPHFDPDALPLADTRSPLSQRPVGGLGWFLIRKVTDLASVERVGPVNILTLARNRNRSDLSPTSKIENPPPSAANPKNL